MHVGTFSADFLSGSAHGRDNHFRVNVIQNCKDTSLPSAGQLMRTAGSAGKILPATFIVPNRRKEGALTPLATAKLESRCRGAKRKAWLPARRFAFERSPEVNVGG